MSNHNLLTFRVMPKAKTSEEIKNFFGSWFQKEREKRGISQKYVAGKVDLSVTQLSRIENGDSGTRRDTVIQLANTIGADEDEALRIFYGNSIVNEDAALLEKIRLELADSFLWTAKQKEDLYHCFKIFVAGIKAQVVNDEIPDEPMKKIKQDDFIVEPTKKRMYKQSEFIVEEVDDGGTINIDKKGNRKAG